ncbi:ABC transporter substrate-binding protein [Desulfolithobacter dissulfuricans]|uniref:ABC transporter substrate-binding protein n=1 Tax=Desulfolithobacter dissulfuricans TaxID=2795293 RepID=A0A915XJW6_9BACT|nr:ABC transporter substrate-binding protein [Desulfolithobacter dissulfuricans]BCO09177.1 ABC transporter substrate-binding protein [Desulfolithobacter dissulfuricans]
MKRFILPGITLLMLALFFSTTVVAVEKEEEKVLTVVSPWRLKGMNLHKSGFLFARMGCVETLTTTDNRGKIVGLLARSWTVSPDRLTWTFTLRPDITFHDQTPLTAGAVSKSLNIALKNRGVLAKAKIAEITPISPRTLRITTTQPFAPLPAYLAHYSAAIVSEGSFDEQGRLKHIYGTGPYILTGQQGDIRFDFKANPSYWGEKPQVQYVRHLGIPEAKTRANMILNGEADMAFTLSPADMEELQAAEGVRVVALTIPRTRLLVLNCALPFFSTVRSRQALSLAIDRRGIAADMLRNPNSMATQLLPYAAAMWHTPELIPLEYNLLQARKMLEEDGWQPGEDDILEKNGQRFEFELRTYSTRPMLPVIAASLQQQLRKVGIEMHVVVGKGSDIPAHRADNTLQAALIARNFALIPDAIGTIYNDFGPDPGNWGAFHWQSDELNELLERYLETFDQERAEALRVDILTVLQRELPVIPISWYEHIIGLSDRIEGVNIDPYELKSYLNGVRWAR